MKDQVQRAIYNSIEMLLKADYDLLNFDVNERSISHRFAKYLEPHFPGWNVDCEYNRNYAEIKSMQLPSRNVAIDDITARTVFPDIIVHKRNTDENLLVIEMKKTGNREGDDFDRKKLSAYKEQLRYKYAILIKIRTGPTNPGIEQPEWF